MEEFLDYILIVVLILLLGFTGGLIFLLEKHPLAAYGLITAFLVCVSGGIGVLGWKFYQKKQLAPYYELLQEIVQLKKEIFRSTTRLERPLKKMMREQFPKIRQLCREAKTRLYKITEIDNTLASLEQKQLRGNEHYRPPVPTNHHLEEKLEASYTRYTENLKKIQDAKNHYMQEVEHVLSVLQELNSQILALKFAQGNVVMQKEIAETIDDLLIDMHTLEELT